MARGRATKDSSEDVVCCEVTEAKNCRKKLSMSLSNGYNGNFPTKGNQLPVKKIHLPHRIADEIRSAFNEQGNHIRDEIGRAFGIDQVGKLVRKEKRDMAKIAIRKYVADDKISLEHKLELGLQGAKFEISIPEDISIFIGDDEDEFNFNLRYFVDDELMTAVQESEDTELIHWHIVEFLSLLGEHIRPYVFGPLYLPAFYLPADRTGVMHAHSAVVSAMIGSAPMTGLRPSARTPMLSGVLADFLQQLIEIDRSPYGRRPLRRDLGTSIEKTILGGSVNVDRTELIDYPRFTYRPIGWRDALPLMNASSMVSELAPVVLYLRHMVRPDNVLIIEEPESHLHPAMQVEFTRQLAALVRAGVRVIVTTHSEWVLEELANIVRSSRLPASHRRGIAGSDVALGPDQVGAWLFKPSRRPRGSTVEEVVLDEETGLYSTDYDAVSQALYDRNVKIFNRIQDGGE